MVLLRLRRRCRVASRVERAEARDWRADAEARHCEDEDEGEEAGVATRAHCVRAGGGG